MVLNDEGDALQLVRVAQTNDHRPLMVTTEVNLVYWELPKNNVRCDFDKIMAAVIKGEGRQEFVDLANKSMEKL